MRRLLAGALLLAACASPRPPVREVEAQACASCIHRGGAGSAPCGCLDSEDADGTCWYYACDCCVGKEPGPRFPGP